MGHSGSKSNAVDSDASSGISRRSRRSRMRSALRRRLHRGCSSSSSDQLKHLTAENFAGIALLEIVQAEMQFKDRWFACVSLGERTFRTATSDHTDKPVWNSEKKLLLEQNGPHVARISVFETNRLSKNNLIGYCEIDLYEALTKDLDSDMEVLDLLDPSSSSTVVGKIHVSCSVENYDGDGKLSYAEFSELINTFGNELAAEKVTGTDVHDPMVVVAYLSNGTYASVHDAMDGAPLFHWQVTSLQLRDCLENTFLLEPVPVCMMQWTWEPAFPSDKKDLFESADTSRDGYVSVEELATLLAVHQEKESLINCCPVCGESLHNSDRLNNMIHLTLCFDEGTGNQVMTGGFLTDKQASYGYLIGDRRGAKELLQSLSEKQGRRMNSVESAKEIPKFIEFFKTFNEFFIRELKPGARPIAFEDRDDLATCAADSRLMAFKSVEDGMRFWIKGRKFSIKGILGADISSSEFTDGSLVIFRLAPQDYHRFHAPVSGTIEKVCDISGALYTVNPIAVNSKYFNVFTENKRVVAVISTEFFGKLKNMPRSDVLMVINLLSQLPPISLCIIWSSVSRYNKFQAYFPESLSASSSLIICSGDHTIVDSLMSPSILFVILHASSIVHLVQIRSGSRSRRRLVALIAVGATMVGSITLSKKEGNYVQKGDEFGYFSFGGSTVICIFEKDAIEIDEDLLANSARSLETLVAVGMMLGVSRKKQGESGLPNIRDCKIGE
ncbi:hypothetical protein Sjap_021831 [Stephania japonica]|uniref:Phosphatidylserine decarboxylase n=1 Tax=Stephania japonica TaxID=461633 RepID=A0AAP0EN44_9MAGN